MNTFEMTLFGWSGELSLHRINHDMYEDLMNADEDDAREKLYDLMDCNVPIKSDIGNHNEGDYFYWHDGDIECGIRPTNHVYSVEVNGKDIDITTSPLDLFPERTEVELQNGYEEFELGLVHKRPTIGFCSFEKGMQGSYTIETTDKEFDISKVEVDVLHTSFGSFIEGYYYDGKEMEQKEYPEGDPKNTEVNFGYLPIVQLKNRMEKRWNEVA